MVGGREDGKKNKLSILSTNRNMEMYTHCSCVDRCFGELFQRSIRRNYLSCMYIYTRVYTIYSIVLALLHTLHS